MKYKKSQVSNGILFHLIEILAHRELDTLVHHSKVLTAIKRVQPLARNDTYFTFTLLVYYSSSQYSRPRLERLSGDQRRLQEVVATSYRPSEAQQPIQLNLIN